ncbi:hypothetical protein [Flavobacterium sp.]|uniref:hypothetical protein n=1 Tax=Flavobacterium sp. TaxID=239 RepID=UPI0025BFAD1C|nr:hypothetical protein [Flavobacterium sp.]
MKVFCAIVLALLVLSCGDSVDASERIACGIKVIDSQGNPVEGAVVAIRSASEITASEYDSRLNEIKSNANGDSFMVFPKPTSERINVQVTDSTKVGGQAIAEYEMTKIIGVRNEQCVGFRFPITQVTVFKTAELTDLTFLILNNSDAEITSAKLVGALSGVSNYNDDFDLERRPDYRVRKNQTVMLHYSVRQNGSEIETDHSESIEIGTEPVSFKITI